MTLKKLLIQNFQAHSKQKIEFDNRITTIVGSSDVGKSAILRALRWVCRNHPQGESFIKEGTTGTTVKLKIDDIEIIRKRGKGENSYLLNGKTFKAFGNNVPDTIADKLNLNDLNFQNQHDAPFWFALSAPEVSRQLNAIVDLGIIDSSLSAIGKKVRNLQQRSQFTKDRLKEARDNKKELDWVIEADSAYKIIEKYDEERTVLHHDTLDLTNMIDMSNQHIETRQTAISQVSDLKSVGKLGQECLKLAKERSALAAQIKYAKQQQKLLDIGFPDIAELESVSKEFEKLNEKRESLTILLFNIKQKRKSIDGGSPDISKLEKAHDEYEILKNKVWNLEINILAPITNSIMHLGFARIKAKALEKNLHKATDGRCPVCGKEIE